MGDLVHGSLHAINRISLSVASFSILLMAILGGLDVITTHGFSKPLPSAYEATETLMVLTVYLGLGVLHEKRGHIAVDLFYARMPSAMQRAIDILALLLMLSFFALLAYRGWLAAERSWMVGEYSVGLIRFPIFPARFALAFGCTVAAACCVADLVFGRRPQPAEKSMDLT